MYLYTEGVDEISFDPDDIITNIEVIDDGWYMGDFGGKRGLFPSNYVEKISDDGAEAPAPSSAGGDEVSEGRCLTLG